MIENEFLTEEEKAQRDQEARLASLSPSVDVAGLQDAIGFKTPEPVQETPYISPEETQPLAETKLTQYQDILSRLKPEPVEESPVLREPAEIPMKRPEPSKEDLSIRSDVQEIEELDNMIATDNTLTDSDMNSMKNYRLRKRAALAERKGVQVTKKTKEEKKSDKEIKEIELGNEERLDNLISREGNELEVYKDSLGHETIGVGHLLTDEEKASGSIYGIDFSGGLTDEQSKEILKKDLEKHNAETDQVMEEFGIDKSKLSIDQISALRDMNFQLGSGSQRGFKNTLKFIAEGNYEAAAENAAKSKWAKQTPVRVQDFQNRIIKVKGQSPKLTQEPSVIQGILDGDFKQKEEQEVPENLELDKLQNLLSASKNQTDIPNQSNSVDIPVQDSPADIGQLRQIEEAGMNAIPQEQIEDNTINPDDMSPEQYAQFMTESERSPASISPEVSPEVPQTPEQELLEARKQRNMQETIANMGKYIKKASSAYGGGRLTQLKADTSMEDDMLKKAGRPVAELLADRKAASEKEISDMKNIILKDKVELSEKGSEVAKLKSLALKSRYGDKLKGIELGDLSANQLSEVENVLKSGNVNEYKQMMLQLKSRRLDQSDIRIKDRNEDDFRKDKTSLAKELTKSEVLPMQDSITAIERLQDEGGENILNILQRTQPGVILQYRGKKGTAIHKAKLRLQAIINAKLKKQSGAAVSDQELKRFEQQMGMQISNAPGSIFEALKILKEQNQIEIDNIRSGYNQDVNEAQIENYNRISKKENKSAEKKPNLSPEFLKQNAGKSFSKNGIRYQINQDGTGLE